jgi:predicted secreted protein
MRVLVAAIALAVALAPTAEAKTYRKSDSGKRVKVAKGKTFKVRLKQHTGGGYLWRYAKRPDRAVVKRVKKRTITPCKAAYCVGGNSIIVWTFKAVGRGRTKIRLVEQRPFEKDKKPINRFKLSVRVVR